jgi:hypothetical protein
MGDIFNSNGIFFTARSLDGILIANLNIIFGFKKRLFVKHEKAGVELNKIILLTYIIKDFRR